MGTTVTTTGATESAARAARARSEAAKGLSARPMARAGLALLYAIAALLGLGAGFRFGWQAGGGYVLAGVAGLCFGVFCTLMVDALVDRMPRRRQR